MTQHEADMLLGIFQRHKPLRDTSAILERITSKSEWLRQDSSDLADFVELLAEKRDFPTLAEDAMERAEIELVEALDRVRASRAAYAAKPVEDSAND